jgi:hypothetical protein
MEEQSAIQQINKLPRSIAAANYYREGSYRRCSGLACARRQFECRSQTGRIGTLLGLMSPRAGAERVMKPIV